MKPFSRAGWAAFGLGGLAYVVSFAAAPRILGRLGVEPRIAARYTLDLLMFVAPVGLLATGALGVAAQELRASSMLVFVGVTVAGAVANAFAYGTVVEGVKWSRVRLRPMFWVIVLGIALYWGVLLATWFM